MGLDNMDLVVEGAVLGVRQSEETEVRKECMYGLI